MPKLRIGEKMQPCRAEFHSQIRLQKYYIKRTYYNELEQQFCPGCCAHLLHIGVLTAYKVKDGYVTAPGVSVSTVLSTYGNDKVVLA